MNKTKHGLFSKYPRVEVEQGTIIIINENDDRTIWDVLDDPEEAMEIAQEIEKGLQIIAHVKKRLLETFEELAREISDTDVPRETRAEYFWEAYWEIHCRLPQLLERILV